MGNYTKLCIKAYDDYHEEKKENKNLKEKDRTNKLNKSNDAYQYKSFMNDHSFLENQDWLISKPKETQLFYPEKLISAYPDYQFDQVKIKLFFLRKYIKERMEGRWRQINMVNAKSFFDRDINKSICPNWKYLIRK